MSVGATYLQGTSGAAVSSGARVISRATSLQTSDVRIYHTADGGEIDFAGGAALLDDGLESFCYLSLFGGNERDAGLPGDLSLQWWGNIGEIDPARHYRSETQHLLRALPAIPANLRRLEDAVLRDLAALTDSQLARSVTAAASMPARNTVELAITVELAPGEEHRFTFRESWGART